MRRRVVILTLVLAAAAGCHHGTAARPDAGSAPRVAAPEAPAPRPPRGKQITIVYSSNLLGEYEPCG
jgi:hypothetical protein